MLAAEENPCRRTYSVGSDWYRFQWSSRESFYQYISLDGIIRHVLLVSSASFDRLLDTTAPTMLIDDSSSAFTWNIPKLRSVGSSLYHARKTRSIYERTTRRLETASFLRSYGVGFTHRANAGRDQVDMVLVSLVVV